MFEFLKIEELTLRLPKVNSSMKAYLAYFQGNTVFQVHNLHQLQTISNAQLAKSFIVRIKVVLSQ